MSKYQLGDLVNVFEGEYWVYGLNQKLNIKSKGVDEFGVEFDTQEEFDQTYEIAFQGYFRCGNPCRDLKEDGYRYQFHEAKKGRGAMPITAWEYVGGKKHE
jgi:hypothetical protein